MFNNRRFGRIYSPHEIAAWQAELNSINRHHLIHEAQIRRRLWLEREIQLGTLYLSRIAINPPPIVIAPSVVRAVMRPAPIVIQDAPPIHIDHSISAPDENEYQTALATLRSTLEAYPRDHEQARKVVTQIQSLIIFIEREKNDLDEIIPLRQRINQYARVLNETNALANRPTNPGVRANYQALMNQLQGAPTTSTKIRTLMGFVFSAIITLISICALSLSAYNPALAVLGSVGLVGSIAGMAGTMTFFKKGMYSGFAKQAKSFHDAAERMPADPQLNRPVHAPGAQSNPAFFAAPAMDAAPSAPPSYEDANHERPPAENPVFRN